MGQTLSVPATSKHTDSGGNVQFLYAVSEMQGWRISMEDAHATVLELDEGQANSNTFFAVYDGHGGGTVAKFAGQNVHKRLVTEEAYQQKQYKEALKRAFMGTDEDLLANPTHARDPSGCTAVAALITPDGEIYVANAGDSRSVIGVKGEVKDLSQDHKPTNFVEKERIQGAGGYVEYGRVNGNLALSRAIGDFEFKKNYSLTPEKQIITSDPDVSIHQISDEDEFFVLACDGIWDCLTSQQVVDFVRYQVSDGKELSEICEMMFDHCLAPDTSSGAGIGCDNMTILIVAILHGRTKEEWYAWVTDRVRRSYGYITPSTTPQLYAQGRINAFRARQAVIEARERERALKEKKVEEVPKKDARKEDTSVEGLLAGTGLSGFSRVLSTTGGISFVQGSAGIMSDSGTLMFSNNESDEDDDLDEPGADQSDFNDTLGLGPESPDPTKQLKAKLDEFEENIRKEDGDSQMVDAGSPGSHTSPSHGSSPNSPTTQPSLQGEAPPPPKPLLNGLASTPLEQLHSQPHGDEPLAVVKAEGLLDSSEDPLVKA